MSVEVKKALWSGIITAVVSAVILTATGTALTMWRDMAVLESKVKRLEDVGRYYHGDSDDLVAPPPKEKTR